MAMKCAGVGTWSPEILRPGLFRTARISALASVCLFGCARVAPVPKLGQKLKSGGEIQYTLHSPDKATGQRVILAHGFLRSPRTMHHLAELLAGNGIQSACIDLRHSRPWAGNHDRNARDMIALRQALGWENAAYGGFSAGGLSALLAAAEDPGCGGLLLLDPVDQGGLGVAAARQVRVPVLAILGRPGPGNAWRNAAPMLAAIPTVRIIEIPAATHCDFEGQPSILCHLFTATVPDAARTAAVHQSLSRSIVPFMNLR